MNHIFIGVRPCGMSYADRRRNRNGDYLRLAFLSFSTLELMFNEPVTEDVKQFIESHAAGIQAKKGQEYTITSSGQTVILGL